MTPQPSESFQPPPGSTTSTAVSEVADADKQRPLSPAHRALLRAALGNGQAALDAYAEWQRWVDLDALDDEAYRQLPRLYRNLVRLGVQDAQMPRLRGIYRRTWYGNRLALLWMGEVLSTLANAGAEAPVLTGALLHLHTFDDPAACPLAGLDLLIRPEQVQPTLALLAGAGWRIESEDCCGEAPPVAVGDARRGWENEGMTEGRGGEAPPVAVGDACTLLRGQGEALGLHWRIIHGLPERQRATAEVELWQRVVPLHGLDLHASALGAIDQLLFLVDYGFNNPTCVPIRWAFDAAAVIAGQPGLPWDDLVAAARQRQRGRELADMLACLQTTLDLPVPPGTVDQLRSQWQPMPGRQGGISDYLHPLGRVAYAGRTLWASYERSATAATASGFLRYLAAHWGLTSIWQLPGAMAARAARMMRREGDR